MVEDEYSLYYLGNIYESQNPLKAREIYKKVIQDYHSIDALYRLIYLYRTDVSARKGDKEGLFILSKLEEFWAKEPENYQICIELIAA